MPAPSSDRQASVGAKMRLIIWEKTIRKFCSEQKFGEREVLLKHRISCLEGDIAVCQACSEQELADLEAVIEQQKHTIERLERENKNLKEQGIKIMKRRPTVGAWPEFPQDPEILVLRADKELPIWHIRAIRSLLDEQKSQVDRSSISHERN